MTPKEMHMMRLQAKAVTKTKKLRTPIQREIEIRREKMIRDVLKDVPEMVKQQVKISKLTVSDEGKNNDVVLKASNSLLDRVFGQPIKSVDFRGKVEFSLRDLSKKADEMEGDIIELKEIDEYGEL